MRSRSPLRLGAHDPYFLVLNEVDQATEAALRRGSLLTLGPSPDEGDRRPIVGVSVAGTIIASGYVLLAPKRVTDPSARMK
ncbi:MAG TPA: hypothetical protein VD846_02190 [Allosphingosinicella sp.]|nr:hypothetical protein [Allosphingosinicella sp.]